MGGWSNFPENWETDGKPPVEVLEIDRIPQSLTIGEKYHCSWASSKGMVWRLIGVANNQATLETPRTKRQITTHINHLRVLNSVAKQNAKKRIKKENEKEHGKI